MGIRTDLIDEIKAQSEKNLSCIETNDQQIGDVKISTVKVTDNNTAQILKKPIGVYSTISFPRLDFVCDNTNIIKSTVKALKTVAGTAPKNALVVGLGNVDITPDALGPKTCNRVLATRHLNNALKRDLGLDGLKSVCCIAPNVLGKTGIESFDLISAAACKIKPDIIIAVDALACREPQRLCRTVQISNSGIGAGSGVNNARLPLNCDTLGVPVIAVGVPTVIDGNSFFENTSKENMMVTPKEIDLLIDKSAQILSRAINIFLQPELDIEIIESLT